VKTVPDSHLDIAQSAGVTYVATVCPDGLVSITPVSAIWDGVNVKFSTKKGRGKYANLLLDDRVSACMQHATAPFRYLEFRGRGRIVEDADRSFVNAIAQRFLGKDEYPGDKPGDERVIVIIDVEHVAGPGIANDAAPAHRIRI
jgi:PPOX class probable F420-dependent enzyme